MSPVRARTRTARPGVERTKRSERTNHEATAERMDNKNWLHAVVIIAMHGIAVLLTNFLPNEFLFLYLNRYNIMLRAPKLFIFFFGNTTGSTRDPK